MRRALLALLVLASALPAVAATPTIPAAPKPLVKAAPVPATPVEAPSFVIPAPIPLAVGRPGGDALQCKATCAKTLYFCNATGDDDGCSSRWAQCNASCSSTYAAPRYGR